MIKNKIVSNSIWIISCKVIQSLLSLVISMLTARYLGPSNFGVINYAASVVAFVTPLSKLGINSILVKELIKSPEKEGDILGSSILMSVLSSILSIIGVVSFSLVSNADEPVTILVCFLYSIQLIFIAMEMVQYWFQAKYLSKYYSVTAVVAYIFVSVYKIFLLATKKEVYWFALSNSIDFAVIAIILLIIYRKLGGQKLTCSLPTMKLLLSEGRHYILADLMVVIFAQTDKIMLKFISGDIETGYYAAAVACTNITNFVFLAIMDSMRPAIFESLKRDENLFKKNVSRLYCIIIYLSIAQSIGITLLAKPIIYILYGNSYYPAIPILQLIVWYTTFSYLGTVRNIWMLARDLQKYLWTINVCGAIANIVLNIVLIPIYGGIGAAFASLVTQIFTNVILGFIFKSLQENNSLMINGLRITKLFNFKK